MSLIRRLFICSKAPSPNDSGQAYGAEGTEAEKKHGPTDTGSDTEGRSHTEAECAICQDKLDEPCTVPCGNRHIFCLACLKGVITHNSHRSHFPCPLCRKRVRIPMGGVSAFRNNKTLGQKLRSKLPAFRPRSRHRRHRSRSGLRSTEYVTVSFPVLGYSDDLDLQLDILSSIYNAHHGPRPVNHERVMGVILDEIGQAQERPSPGPSRPQDALWLSDDAENSTDSDQEDDTNDASQQAVSTRSGPPFNEDPRLRDAEDLDMSVVLQIIADMEEIERRREASRGTAQTSAADSILSPRSESGSVLPQSSDSGNNYNRSPGSEDGENEDHTSCRPINSSTSSQTRETGNTSQRLDAGRAGTERSESGSATSQRPETGSASSQRPETGSASSQRPETGSASSQGPETGSVSSQRPETRSASPQKPETSNTASQRADIISSVSSQGLEASTDASRRPANGAADCSITKEVRSETSSTASQISGLGHAPSARPQPDSAAAEISLCTDAVALQRSERNGNSSQRSNMSQSVPEKTSRGKSQTTGQHNDSATSEKFRTTGARSQKSDRNSPGTTTAQSSPLRQSSPESSVSDGSRELCPCNDKTEHDSTGKRPDLCGYRWMPRPRMGSFKMAIAAGQTDPAPYEESPPLLPAAQHSQASVSALGAMRGAHGTSSSLRNLHLPPADIKTKSETRQRPFRMKYHPKQTLHPDAGPGVGHRSEDLPVQTMDSADREIQEKLVSLMDSGDGPYSKDPQRPARIATATEDSAGRNSSGRLQQTEWKLHELQCKDTINPLSHKEHSAMFCRLDTPEMTSQASHPELRCPEGRDGRRRSEQSQEQIPNISMVSPHGPRPEDSRPQLRNHRSRQTTTAWNHPREKTNPRPVTVSGAELQEQEPLGHRPPPARKDPDDSEEWTRRIRGLQRRVISQTRSRAACSDGHGVSGAQLGSGGSLSHHPQTFVDTPVNVADDRGGVSDTRNTGASVVHV